MASGDINYKDNQRLLINHGKSPLYVYKRRKQLIRCRLTGILQQYWSLSLVVFLSLTEAVTAGEITDCGTE
jgi:hypothetical protein